ncbi:hypothetical protein MIND_00493100 [Mycena indigotica]|uniref:Transmembrane protein n=1 Tax=Mycena indigotica TaxID=2126181 RepID=A0A8H6SW41_9AGAR|nr:uncharacterized protein MIND_00493100 [Mycena indigotica]KAF7307003.1 hypothetical protein MIND_00493100 [Mycena indigotica]
MKPREYCCCAIPLINAGIYLALIEQLIAGVAAGILSVATPSIVGAVTPSFASAVFGVVCFVGAAIQILGFIGVAQEKPILFRRYLTLHSLATTGAFSVALAWIILSLTRHSTAKSDCVKNFFSNATPEQKSQGDVLCDVFPWVEVGVMGGLWVVMAIMHIYLYVVMSGYSSGQQRDHANYDSLGDTTFANDNIAMKNRSQDPFAANPRPSGEALYSQEYHQRQESISSLSDVMAQPIQQNNQNYRQATYPPTMPPGAHTEDETPTPRVGASYYDAPYDKSSSNIEKPPQTQSHPAEGSFGRKTPRLIQKNRPFDNGYY